MRYAQSSTDRTQAYRADANMHLRFMAEALAEALQGLSEGGIPVGSVLVRDQRIIGRGHNQRVQQGNPVLHGEMECLVNAGRQTSYVDTVIYTTLSPCMMCAGTILQFKIPLVIIGDSKNFGGNEPFLQKNGVEVIVLNDVDCIEMMGRFINERKELWAEDIGDPRDSS